MNITPISFKQNAIYNHCNQKSNVSSLAKEIDLPSQVDAKNYVNVNFRANTSMFDSFIHRLGTRDKFNTKTLADMPSLQVNGIADKLKNLVIEPLLSNKINHSLNFKQEIPYGLIFSDKPGTGKTIAAELLAKECRLPLYRINISEIACFDPKKGEYESKENIDKVFEQLRQKFEKTGEPSILHIEDADGLFSELERENCAPHLLDLLSNSEKMGIIPIVETTFKIPYLTKLLPKFHNIKFKNPNTEGRKIIIEEALKQRTAAKSLSADEAALKEIAEQTEGMSPAMLDNIVKRASFDACDKKADITKDDFIKIISDYRQAGAI